MKYSIHDHSHRFALWAAARAAMAGGAGGRAGFTVPNAQKWMKTCNFREKECPKDLPKSTDMDSKHREWRGKIIGASKKDVTLAGIPSEISHGQAAKLINVYMKVRFVSVAWAESEQVAALHPPIDGILLKRLHGGRDMEQIVGGTPALNGIAWKNLCSDGYESLIERLRAVVEGEPFWKIEKYWSI